jgi:hypothetical protein
MVSETVSPDPDAGQRPAALDTEQLAAARVRGLRGRRGSWMAAGVLVVLVAGLVWAWGAGVFSASRSPGTGQDAAAPTTAVVVRGDLSASTPVAATLGYAGSFTVTGQGGGILTWLPQQGQVISQGQVLFQTGNGSPVMLLYGTVPDWRAMGEGITGADVSQLNHDLVALGDASAAQVAGAGWADYSGETVSAVQRLEASLGVPVPAGSLSLGQVAFEPSAVRVAQVTGSLGGPAAGPVLQATSDVQVVMVALDVSQQGEVKPGDVVSVTLPDGRSTPGVVSQVGTVAATATSGDGTTTTTIPVTVTLADPAAAGGLDQAPVTVYITTAAARDVLAVPVTALLARSPGGYVVEMTGPGNTRRYVTVRPGIFDDSTGLVQVTGNLAPGQRVVVASS